MQASSDQFIQATDLKKYYTLGESEVKALDGVSLFVDQGTFLAVIGPSGSGKSTLINMIGAVDNPDSGTIVINGKQIDKFSARKLTTFRRKYVSFVFQFYSLVPTLTARENVEMSAELVGLKRKQLRERAMEVLDAVDLAHREKSYPSQLSGGERQRVAIARALAKRPELILVDEPTGQLDEESAGKIVKLIRDVSKEYGSTTIMVTHDQNQLKYADQVIKMSSGKIKE